MYRKITCFFFSCFLIVLYSFVSMADNSETLDISGMEDGGAEIGQNDFLGSQDHVGDSYVDNEGIQDFVETSPVSTEDSMEGFTESMKDSLNSSPADGSENGGVLNDVEETEKVVQEPEGGIQDSLGNEDMLLENEEVLLDTSKNGLDSEENSVDFEELGLLIQSYMDSEESLKSPSDIQTEDASSSELYTVVLECRDFLESCMYLLVVDAVLLSILIGCLCCSIFSRFLRWWR